MRPALPIAFLSAAIAAQAGASLKQAAALYHRGLYDSALAVLDTCRNGSLKRRDSLALFQYSGMASARLGRDAQAIGDFRSLLSLDSLFQFPRNEEASILSAFARAREETAAPRATEDGPRTPAPVGNGTAADPAPISSASASASASGSAPADGAPGALVPGVPAPAGPSPAPARDLRDDRRGIGLALGAIPFGAGWLAQGRYPHGITLGLLQAGGAALSIYASSRASALENDPFRLLNEREVADARKWQWTQRISLSTALGAYLFSLFAARRD